nr:hypothetical protein [Tanacetum cinerariifolium]
EDEEDDEIDVEADEEEEEEEHPDPADSIVVAPTAANQAPSAKETEPFETDESATTPPPHPAYRTTARISIPAPVPMPAWTDSEVVRLLAISSPPASPLSPWSSPPPQIPFPPLPPIQSPPSPVLSPAPPSSPIRSLGYRAAMIRLRDEAASTSSPPSQLPSASHREDRPEVTLPPWKRLDIVLGPRYEVGESSSAAAVRPAGGFRADYSFVATVDREIIRDPEREVGYGITDSWDEIVETLQGALVSTNTELGGYVREFETRVRQDTDEIYMRLDDEQTERRLLAGRLNMLFRDRRAHAYTRQLMETEARMLSIVHCLGYEAGESLVAAAARPIESRRTDYGFVDFVEAEIRRQRAEDIGYGIRDTWIDPRDVVEEETLTTLKGANTRGRQTEIFQRVEELVDDRQYHYETGRLVDQEARFSREAWAHSMGLGSAVHFELKGYMTHTWVQDQCIDAQDTLIVTLTTQLSSLQGHLTMALGEIRALQASEQARTGAPEGAGSST